MHWGIPAGETRLGSAQIAGRAFVMSTRRSVTIAGNCSALAAWAFHERALAAKKLASAADEEYPRKRAKVLLLS
jgi:hypothetical protein